MEKPKGLTPTQTMTHDSTDSEWEWDNGDDETEFFTPCLFCKSFLALPELLVHLEQEHDMGLDRMVALVDGHQYAYIKFINYVRQHKVPREDVDSIPWADVLHQPTDEYITPVINGDGLLMVDVDWKQEDYEWINEPQTMDTLDDDVRKELQQLKDEQDDEMVEVSSSEDDDE